MVGVSFGCPPEMYDYIRAVQEKEDLKTISEATMLVLQRGKAYEKLVEIQTDEKKASRKKKEMEEIAALAQTKKKADGYLATLVQATKNEAARAAQKQAERTAPAFSAIRFFSRREEQ